MTQLVELDEKELKYLLGALRLASHKWRPLANQLEIKEVDIIEKNHPHDVERCLEEALKRWMKSGKSSADALADALDTIGEGGLARDVRKKYNCAEKGPHRLKPTDLDELFTVVSSAHPQWRNIGRVLGFKHNELSSIVPRGGLTGQRDYFEEMLGAWLKWAPPKSKTYPTTETLVEALQNESVGEYSLALSLSKNAEFTKEERLNME